MTLPRLFIYTAFLCLVACGGGGGGSGSGGGDDSGSNDDNEPEPPEGTLAVSDNSIDITADIDEGNMAFEYLEADITGIEENLRLDVTSQGITLADLRITQEPGNGSAHLDFELEFLAPEMLGFGDHSDQLRIYVCNDPDNCVGAAGQIDGSPFTVDISYTVTGEPRVHHVSPFMGKAGTSGEVSIRGVGFSLLDSPSVKFGAADALSMEVINDTEITATYPALVEGSYNVIVLDNGTPIASETSLELTNEPDFAYAFIARDSIKTEIIYNPRNKTLMVLAPHDDTIERYAYSSGVWNLSLETATDVDDILLTPTGHFMVVSPTNPTIAIPTDPTESFKNIAIAGNGKGLARPAGNTNAGPDTYLYNYRTAMFLGIPGTNFDVQVMGTSGDGRYVISNGEPDLIYDSSTGDIASDTVFGVTPEQIHARALAVDYDGDTVATDGEGVINIYQSRLHTGTITPLLEGSHIERFGYNVSADGSRLYLVERISDDNNSFDHLRIFDLTAPDGAGSFEQIAGSPFSIPNQLSHSRIAPLIAVSPEQKTLFIAGEFGVLVYPVPD